ncbi:MAG: DUF3164 family protein [Pseudodesulfovibrio sp.]|uniref:Uncharacterized protein DUF3164 n=1 Tax=Pseudodesulfovibrio indicus TaxID=1716143 RepID=A0A126QLU0_9BACT|nr:DUF3164 family protein [Pseudodesulfovibrio indicus]AMK10884.1 hypothetical protein AWY79_07065 [Pseudodesulfovibrio indicus]TDT91876.1 uncharacterized protein DUF3164 [Pseudodesulfovibrio indicus]
MGNATHEGFWKDAKGNLVAPENVRESDKLADEVVRDLFAEAKNINAALVAFKQKALDDIRTHLALVVEKYDVKLRGKKGNRVLSTFDGSIKVTINIQDRIRFGEELVAAELLINECMAEWTHDANPNLRTIVEKAFQADSEGKISVYRVLDLLRLQIDDERWRKAMKAIQDSIRVIDSKEYVRIYTRDENGEYQALSLNIAQA